MDEKEFKAKVLDTISQEGVDIEITVARLNLLHKLKILPKKKEYTIYPLTLGTSFRVAKILLSVDIETLEKSKNRSALDLGLEQLFENQERMIEIIAIALHNKRSRPPKSLKRFLQENLTAKEMFTVLMIVVNQMDTNHFLAGMVSARGMSLVETKNKTGGELSAESINTSTSQEKKFSGVTVGQT